MINPRRLLALSFTLSIATIITLIWINARIAHRYDTGDGKTRALFGIIELTYSYKYYLGIVAIFAMTLGFVTIRRGWHRSGILCVVIAMAALVLVFLRVWTLMVQRPV